MNTTAVQFAPLPDFIPRTGELELRQCEFRKQWHAGVEFYATEKLDGFSMSAGWVNGEFFHTARERRIEPGEASVFADAEAALKLRSLLAGFDGLIFQGELIGPKIRGNRYGLTVPQWRIFDVLKAGNGALDFKLARNVVAAAGLQSVPLLGSAPIESCESFCEGKSELADVEKEGAVYRPAHEMIDPIGRVSFKVFNPKF